MEQPLSSLNLSVDNYKTLKSLGFHFLNELENDNVPKNIDLEEWKKSTCVPATKTAWDIYCENCESGPIYLFNKQLDELLENEMITGNIVEICGEAGSGKTQIWYTVQRFTLRLCINVQLPKWLGGKESGALYLCTNYNFSTDRLKEMSQIIVKKVLTEIPEDKKCSLVNFNVDTVLKNIHHIQINSYDEFLALVIYLNKWLRFNKIGILVIDCITFIVQQLDNNKKRQFVYSTFAKLQELAVQYGFVIVVSNNITIRMKSIDQVYKTAFHGEAYYHRVNSRIMLRRLSDQYFMGTLEKSVMRNESTVIFQL